MKRHIGLKTVGEILILKCFHKEKYFKHFAALTPTIEQRNVCNPNLLRAGSAKAAEICSLNRIEPVDKILYTSNNCVIMQLQD